jgi:hypothetical protein
MNYFNLLLRPNGIRPDKSGLISFVYNLFLIARWNSHDWKIFISIGVFWNHAHFMIFVIDKV